MELRCGSWSSWEGTGCAEGDTLIVQETGDPGCNPLGGELRLLGQKLPVEIRNPVSIIAAGVISSISPKAW